MKIIENSIENISTEFNNFAKSLHGWNYVVWIEAKKFNYQHDEAPISLADLQLIFKEEKDINGSINKTTWESSLIYINNSLKYCGDDKGKMVSEEDRNLISKEEHEKRKEIFWKIVKKHIQIPPEEIYVISDNNHFSDYIWWGFSYIFLSEGKGIVIAGGSFC